MQEIAQGWRTDPDTLPWLKELARNRYAQDLRKECVQEIARRWKSDSDTLPWLKDLAFNDHDKDVRQVCAQEIARVWKIILPEQDRPPRG
jgi:hypothetical protein